MKKLTSLFLLFAFLAVAFSTVSAGAAGAAENESGGAPAQNAAAGFSAGAENPSGNSQKTENSHRPADEGGWQSQEGMNLLNIAGFGFFSSAAAYMWSPEAGIAIAVPSAAILAAGCYNAFKQANVPKNSKTARKMQK